MNSVTKKRILISPELQSAQLGAFFREMGFELDSEYDKNNLAEYLFIIDDYLAELNFIPRIQTQKMLSAECLPSVRAFIDVTHLEDLSIKKLLGLYFSDTQNFDLVDRYSKDFKNIYTLKIHDYLNLGYFIDSIVVEAYKQKFDFEQIRNYLNFALPFCLKQVEHEPHNAFVDVSFSYSEEGFAVQIALGSGNFNKNSLALEEFSARTNFFDACYFAKRERLLLSSLWFKEEKLKVFKSYFFTEISGRSASTSSSSLISIIDEDQGDTKYVSELSLDDPSANSKIKGGPGEIDEQWKVKSSGLVEKIQEGVTRIKSLAQELKEDDLVRIISSELDAVPSEARKLVKGILEEITVVGSLEEQQAEFQRILGQKMQEDLSVVRVTGRDDLKNNEPWKVKSSGLVEKIQEEVIKIKSLNQKLQEDDLVRIISTELDAAPSEANRLVKGILEEVSAEGTLETQIEEFQQILGQKSPEDLSHIRISSQSDDKNDGPWKVKSSGLVEKIQDEITKLKSLDQEVQQEDLVRIISKELAASPSEARKLVQGILDEAAANLVDQKNQHDLSKNKLEIQIARMKKVMEQMKNEMIKLRIEAKQRPAREDDDNTDASAAEQAGEEVAELKKLLSKSLEAMKNKEKIAVKQKSDFEQILHAKDGKIQTLESRIEEIKSEFTRSPEFVNSENLERLQSENKNLTLRLELANRKINIISENLEKHDSGSNAKKDKEISNLKSNFQMAQALIDKVKQERNDFEARLIEEKEKQAKQHEEKAGVDTSSKELAEKDKQFASLSTEKKILEEKNRALGIELKKQEQKLKFTQAQLEESQRKKTAQATGPSKSNDVVIKQLESAKSRLSDVTSDLADRKKEIHKLKQENALLSGKAVELEKKLANMEKKAA